MQDSYDPLRSESLQGHEAFHSSHFRPISELCTAPFADPLMTNADDCQTEQIAPPIDVAGKPARKVKRKPRKKRPAGPSASARGIVSLKAAPQRPTPAVGTPVVIRDHSGRELLGKIESARAVFSGRFECTVLCETGLRASASWDGESFEPYSGSLITELLKLYTSPQRPAVTASQLFPQDDIH